MKIGISTASLRRFKTETALNYVKEIGAEICEVYLKTFYEYRPEFAKKYKERLGGVKVGGVRVQSCNFEPQLFAERRRERGDGFYWLDQIMRSAQLFGASEYVFRGIFPENCAEGDFDFPAERLNEISEFCAGYGVRLCLENSIGGLYDSPYCFSELKRRLPSLSGVLDMEQARKSGYPYTMYLKDMAGSISAVRLCDITADGRTCLAGEGVCDFKRIFAELRDCGFDGSVLIGADAYAEVENLKKSVEFLRETADKIK